MLVAIFIFVLIMSILVILSFTMNGEGDGSRTILSMRKNQNSTNFRQSALKKKLEQMAEEKAKFDKKYKIETMCLQAGYKLTYGEFILLGWSSAILIPIVTAVITNNPILGLMFIPVGYMIPGQFIAFIKNRRVGLMEKQVGSFMKLVIERYKSQSDFAKAVEGCLVDFNGQEPFYSELKQTILDINLNVPTGESMDNLGTRTGNKYLKRLADFYKITADLGTKEAKEDILNQAFLQYEENRKIKIVLKKEIAGPVREAYIMLASIPMLIAYQICTAEGYVKFMTTTTMGKVGSAVIVGVMMGSLWFINTKIGAPLE